MLGQTALHLAAGNGRTGVVATLLDRGADVDSRDAIGATPIDWAVLSSRLEVVSLLLARGASVNARDFAGATPLHWAARNRTRTNKDVITLLLRFGADVNARDGNGNTPLQVIDSDGTLIIDEKLRNEIVALLHPHGPTFSVPVDTPSAGRRSTGMPPCSDIAGLATWVKQANPGADDGDILGAAQQMQVLMGCRTPDPPPPTPIYMTPAPGSESVVPKPVHTRCFTIGNVTNCVTQ